MLVPGGMAKKLVARRSTFMALAKRSMASVVIIRGPLHLQGLVLRLSACFVRTVNSKAIVLCNSLEAARRFLAKRDRRLNWPYADFINCKILSRTDSH